jgi:hypothetical protein
MTPEQRLAKLEEQMLVQAELVSRFERETQQRIAIHDEQLESHAVELAEFRATVARVLDLLERFVTGQRGGNGERSKP